MNKKFENFATNNGRKLNIKSQSSVEQESSENQFASLSIDENQFANLNPNVVVIPEVQEAYQSTQSVSLSKYKNDINEPIVQQDKINSYLIVRDFIPKTKEQTKSQPRSSLTVQQQNYNKQILRNLNASKQQQKKIFQQQVKREIVNQKISQARERLSIYKQQQKINNQKQQLSKLSSKMSTPRQHKSLIYDQIALKRQSLLRQKNSKRYILDEQLIGNQKTIQIKIEKKRNYNKVQQKQFNVYFPYDAYQCQQKYMKSILQALENSQNALLQSPTGTGKTLCLLTSVLTWIEQDYQKRRSAIEDKDQRKTKVIYLSRTHTQLKQAQNQLSKTCFRPTMSVFGSRDQLCIKQQLQQLKGRDKVQSCSKGIKLALKKSKQKITEQQDKIACQYFSSESIMINLARDYFMNKIIDLDRIREQGKKFSFCPYYYPYHIKSLADIFFMPYNYLLDIGLLPKYKQILVNSIIIFDEGHNVPDAACSGRNFQLTGKILQGVQFQLNYLENAFTLTEAMLNIRYMYEKQIKNLKQEIKELHYRIDQFLANTGFNNDNRDNNKRRSFADQKQILTKVIPLQRLKATIYELFVDIKKITQNQQTLKQTKLLQNQVIRKLSPLAHDCGNLIEAMKETMDGKFQNLQKFGSFMVKIVQLVSADEKKYQWIDLEVNHYRLFIKSEQNNPKNYSLQLICMTPSLTFKQILQCKPKSIIITSGTLAPLNTWKKQLNLSFAHELSNNHIIKPEQLKLCIVKSGKNGNQFNLTYNNTYNNTKLYKDLVQSVIKLVKNIPNGVLVIFPSYRLIRQFDNVLKSEKFNQQLNESKHIFYQTKSYNDQSFNVFKDKAKSKKGAIMLCVCRGKICQGLDFSDQLCRAVIFIGVPYPNIKDPWINEKKSYLTKLSIKYNNSSITGQQWYQLQTMRAVNQAIGRVIRHKDDYGMIFLFDERYSQPRNIQFLPKWTKSSLQIHQQFNTLEQQTQNFFKLNKSNVNSSNYHENDREQFKKKKKIIDPFSMMMNNGKNKKKIDF